MDIIDTSVLLVALVYVCYLVTQLGTDCAHRVWKRTIADLDEIDLIEAAHVPNATSLETLQIFLAVMVRSVFTAPMGLYKESRRRTWEKSPEMRQLDREIALRRDILGSVSLMLSGYPERARPLFEKERGQRIASQMQAHYRDFQQLSGEGDAGLA